MFKPPHASLSITTIVLIVVFSRSVFAQSSPAIALAETSWTLMPNTVQYAGILKTVDQNVLWTTGAGGVVHTTDGGATWIVSTDTVFGTGPIYAIDAIRCNDRVGGNSTEQHVHLPHN